jgi:hypothetical protein
MAARSKPVAQLRRTERWNKGGARLGWRFERRKAINWRSWLPALNGKCRSATLNWKHGFATVNRERRCKTFNGFTGSEPLCIRRKPKPVCFRRLATKLLLHEFEWFERKRL